MIALEELRERSLALIQRLSDGSRDDGARDELLDTLLATQAQTVEAYRRLVGHRGGSRWPAMPTDVFRYARVASHPPELDRRLFLTSGTTQGARGAHPLRDLRTYDCAARAAARYCLFPDRESMRLVFLAPHESDAPNSSLSYMLGRFDEWFGRGSGIWTWEHEGLNAGALSEALSEAERSGEPVALLGTSFAFVHADEALDDRRFSLPIGSRIMQTGGFKGKSRELTPTTMRRMLSARYGVAEAAIVAEYGMTELCSQMYETTLRDAWSGEHASSDEEALRPFWVPGWVRATVVDPQTLDRLPDGEVGLLRIDDAANIDSVAAVVTSDLAFIRGGRVVWMGRATDAVARGCSLSVEEALER